MNPGEGITRAQYAELLNLIYLLRRSAPSGPTFDGYGGAQAHYYCETLDPANLNQKQLIPPWYSTIAKLPFATSIAGLRALRPGVLKTFHVEFFGNAGNPPGVGVTFQLEYGGTVVPGSQITLDGSNPLTQSQTVTFPDFPYDASDVMRMTATPSVPLNFPVTAIYAEIG